MPGEVIQLLDITDNKGDVKKISDTVYL